MPLTKEQILAADDLPREEVQVPEWGGSVYVRVMSGAERDAYEQSYLEKKGDSYEVNRRNLRAKLAVQTVVNENGERLFSDADVDALGAKNGGALDRIFEVASRLNRISKKDEDDLLKNSEPAPKNSSGIVSPGI